MSPTMPVTPRPAVKPRGQPIRRQNDAGMARPHGSSGGIISCLYGIRNGSYKVRRTGNGCNAAWRNLNVSLYNGKIILQMAFGVRLTNAIFPSLVNGTATRNW